MLWSKSHLAFRAIEMKGDSSAVVKKKQVGGGFCALTCRAKAQFVAYAVFALNKVLMGLLKALPKACETLARSHFNT